MKIFKQLYLLLMFNQNGALNQMDISPEFQDDIRELVINDYLIIQDNQVNITKKGNDVLKWFSLTLEIFSNVGSIP